jgi:hypothetical protein
LPIDQARPRRVGVVDGPDLAAARAQVGDDEAVLEVGPLRQLASAAISLAATTEPTVQLWPLTVSGAPGLSCSGGGSGVVSGASKATT